jgi:hypothetical protein
MNKKPSGHIIKRLSNGEVTKTEYFTVEMTQEEYDRYKRFTHLTDTLVFRDEPSRKMDHWERSHLQPWPAESSRITPITTFAGEAILCTNSCRWFKELEDAPENRGRCLERGGPTTVWGICEPWARWAFRKLWQLGVTSRREEELRKERGKEIVMEKKT